MGYIAGSGSVLNAMRLLLRHCASPQQALAGLDLRERPVTQPDQVSSLELA